MNTFNKIKWVLGIILVFVIVLTTNLIDKDNFNRLRNSVITIYEDRIVANDLIFEMSMNIQEKELAIALSDSSFFKNQNTEINDEMDELISRYSQTQLTPKEKTLFDFLKMDLEKVKALENQDIITDQDNKTAYLKVINNIVTNLSKLSKVQLNEGKRQMAISNKTMEAIDLFTQAEIIFIVILAVIFQIIIIYKPKN